MCQRIDVKQDCFLGVFLLNELSAKIGFRYSKLLLKSINCLLSFTFQKPLLTDVVDGFISNNPFGR